MSILVELPAVSALKNRAAIKAWIIGHKATVERYEIATFGSDLGTTSDEGYLVGYIGRVLRIIFVDDLDATAFLLRFG